MKYKLLCITYVFCSLLVSLSLHGQGTPKIEIDPVSQDFVINIGDVLSGTFTIKNTGDAPLSYFIPGYDELGIEDGMDIDPDYHKFGYNVRTSHAGQINNEFIDLTMSPTATRIGEFFKKGSNLYYPLPLKFSFPFYGDRFDMIYITQHAFTVFKKRNNLPGTPTIGSEYEGFISLMGSKSFYTVPTGALQISRDRNVLYEFKDDRLIIQYHNISTDPNPARPPMGVSAQMVLYANGDIRFYYTEVADAITQAANDATICIESLQQADGIILFGNVRDGAEPRVEKITPVNNMAIGFDFPGSDIISGIGNGSGMIAPGEQVTVTVNFDTGSLVEGKTKRSVQIYSNDPENEVTNTVFNIDVAGGGVPEMSIDKEEIDFGEVYDRSPAEDLRQTFKITNSGNGMLYLDFLLDNPAFTLLKDNSIPIVIARDTVAPKSSKSYIVVVNNTNKVALSGNLNVTGAGAGSKTLELTAAVMEAPLADMDLSRIIYETLDLDEVKYIPYEVRNLMGSPLRFSAYGDEWLSYVSDRPASRCYYETIVHDAGENYNWYDISETGTKIDIELAPNPREYWYTMKMDEPFEFYGEKYDTIMIAANGIISIGGYPEALINNTSLPLPNNQLYDGGFIMPCWGDSFEMYNSDDQDLAGLYFRKDSDKTIITWEYLRNIHGTGALLSAQAILFNDGKIKFQYKNRSDNPTEEVISFNYAILGMVNPNDHSDYISVSQYTDFFVNNKGVSVVILPVKEYTISAGEVLEGEVKLDASELWGGKYGHKVEDGFRAEKEGLQMRTNDPYLKAEILPVRIDVIGEYRVECKTLFDFGTVEMQQPNNEPDNNKHYIELEISNAADATAPFTIDMMSAGVEDALNIQTYAYMKPDYGEFKLDWYDVNDVFVGLGGSGAAEMRTSNFTVNPGDKVKFRAIFRPNTKGTFSNTVVVSLEDGTSFDINLKGVAINPPAIELGKTEIKETFLKLTDEKTHTVTVKNVSEEDLDLKYKAVVEYKNAELRGDDDVKPQWVSVVSNAEATLGKGDSKEVSIKIDGAKAVMGKQEAELVFYSNATWTPVKKVSVILNMNEAPVFSNLPENLQVAENGSKTHDVNIADPEGHSFTVEVVKTNAILTHTYGDGVLSLTFAPDYGDTGSHEYIFKATDDHGASCEQKIQIEVFANQPPAYISDDRFIYTLSAEAINYGISDLFEDPDGDEIAVEVVSADESIIEISTAGTVVAVRTIAEGETYFTLTATDMHGAITKKEVNVTVEKNENLSGRDIMLIPNLVHNSAQLYLGDYWKGDVVIEIYDFSGRLSIRKSVTLSGADVVDMDLSEVPPGKYVVSVRFENKKKRKTVQFIKSNGSNVL